MLKIDFKGIMMFGCCGNFYGVLYEIRTPSIGLTYIYLGLVESFSRCILKILPFIRSSGKNDM